VPKSGEHKERLLEFNCGLVGGATRSRGHQYLDVDGRARSGVLGGAGRLQPAVGLGSPAA
jgi:hypothetical protein